MDVYDFSKSFDTLSSHYSPKIAGIICVTPFITCLGVIQMMIFGVAIVIKSASRPYALTKELFNCAEPRSIENYLRVWDLICASEVDYGSECDAALVTQNEIYDAIFVPQKISFTPEECLLVLFVGIILWAGLLTFCLLRTIRSHKRSKKLI